MNKAWNILLRKFPQKPLFSEDTATRPVSVSVDEVVQGNNRMLRKRIVLKTGGCQTKTCTMCAIPTESIPSKISTEDIIAQLNFSWNTQEPVSIITLYTNGNFFYDKEMSESTRVAIYRWCSSKGITHKTQIANLTPGRYVLIDDDIVSGYTVDLIKQMLPPTVRIVEEISLLRLWWTHFGDTPLDLYDIIDARDFATNQAYGGLVIQDPSVSSPIRAPYTDVRVNLATRAKLAPYQIKPFKDELQKLRQTTEISAVTPLSNMV